MIASTTLCPPDGPSGTVLLREAGYAVRTVRLAADAAPSPPGQGQIVVLVSGSGVLEELGGAGAVVHTPRPDRRWDLRPGTVARIANDGRWRLTGDGIALCIITSVPRAAHRVDDLAARAARTWRCSPAALFENEVVRVEWLAGRGWLPGAGGARGDGGDALALLQGAARLESGAALRLTAPSFTPLVHPWRLQAAPRFLALLISPVLRRRLGAPDRAVVRGFTPFARA